jgi:hypothetical protein
MKNIIPLIKTFLKYRRLDIFLEPKKLVDVKSNAVKTVRYDSETNELVVDFNRGTSYRYFQVGIGEFYRLISDNSVGKYFVEKIRNNYSYQQEIV